MCRSAANSCHGLCLTAAASILATAGMAVAYWRLIRPWHLGWGASLEEADLPMPGDHIIERPHLAGTRALTIRAAPREVWPWLVQMGYRRGGFYAIDRLDNDGIPSATTILAEYQNLKVGDLVPTGKSGGFTVEAIEANRLLLLAIRDPRFTVTLCTRLEPVGPGVTRVVMRIRARFGPGIRMTLYRLIFDPGDFVMMRAMMLGIRQRAERLARESATPG